MEPNNFEKDFREKLNQRRIEPSDKAWDRLGAMLSVAENKKPKKDRKWLYVAASLVGFLLLGTFFFNQQNNQIIVPEEKVVLKEELPLDSNEEINSEIKSDNVVLKNNANKTVAINEPNLSQTQKAENKKEQATQVSIINQSINQENKIIISEQSKTNIDSLLKEAELAIGDESTVSKQKISVNSASLLSQVDNELEPSFREKVINRVSKNYQAVKVAIVNRNIKE